MGLAVEIVDETSGAWALGGEVEVDAGCVGGWCYHGECVEEVWYQS